SVDPSSAPARPLPIHTAAERHTSGRRGQTASTRDIGIVSGAPCGSSPTNCWPSRSTSFRRNSIWLPSLVITRTRRGSDVDHQKGGKERTVAARSTASRSEEHTSELQ